MIRADADRTSDLLIELRAIDAFIGYLGTVITRYGTKLPAIEPMIEVHFHGFSERIPFGNLGEPLVAQLWVKREAIISKLAALGVVPGQAP